MKHLRIALLASSALIPFGPLTSLANPLGPDVAAGDVSMSGVGTPGVIVDQSSDKAIIDWRSFNIDPSESTTFNQPGAGSVVLNRVTGGEGASQILGTLRANGQVFLINPDGILFGKDATIDVGSLVATTHDLLDSDFLKGNYDFNLSGNPAASVVNLGQITVNETGFAALVAPGVRNAGTITARLGTVALASASTFSLDPYGDGLIKLGLGTDTANEVIDLSTGKPLNALVGNDGSILADGGLVQLSAAATRKVIDSVVNNTGHLEADSVGVKNGKIVLSAATASTRPFTAPAQTVKVSGNLSTSGKKAGEKGGAIEITGEQISLAEATIDAFGWSGGGSVLVGGDLGGGNAAEAASYNTPLADHRVATSLTTRVDAGTIINASATAAGDGGKVVVWSDGHTTYRGTIKARGGAISGDGGFVETSGHQLVYAGAVDTSATKGKTGTLLLDPLDVTIGTSGTHTITPTDIEAALLSNDVVVTTGSSGTDAGDVAVAEGVSWSNANSLSINAARNLAVNAAISNTGGADVNLRADDRGTGTGNVAFGSGGSVNTTGAVNVFYNPDTFAVAEDTLFTPNVTAGSFNAFMLVNNVDELQLITQNLKGNYALGRDIDASVTATWNNGAGFLPIGTGVSPNDAYFGGQFDGLGHTIEGLTIHSDGSHSLGVGLFGGLNPGPYEPAFSRLVWDLNITNADIKAVNYGGYTGILVGDNNQGGIDNVAVSGTVSSNAYGYVGGLAGFNIGHIDNSTADVTMTGSATAMGGLVGVNYNYGRVYQSSANANITAVGGYLGGLVGWSYYNEASVFESHSSGSVTALNGGTITGGLVGGNGAGNLGGYVQDSYSTASVSSAGTPQGIGGLVGMNDTTSGIESSLALGNVQVATNSGGLIGVNNDTQGYYVDYWDIGRTGQTSSAAGTGLTDLQIRDQLHSGLDPSIWGIDPTYNDEYPYLLWERAAAPSAPTVLTPDGIEPPPPPPPPEAPNDTTGATQTASITKTSGTLALLGWLKDTVIALIPGAAGSAANHAAGIYDDANSIAELTVELDEMIKGFNQQNRASFDFELQDKCGSNACTEAQIDAAVDDLVQLQGITLNGMSDIVKTLLGNRRALVRALFVRYASENGRSVPDLVLTT